MLASSVEDWRLVVNVPIWSVTRKRVKLGSPQLQIGLIEVADDKEGTRWMYRLRLVNKEPALSTTLTLGMQSCPINGSRRNCVYCKVWFRQLMLSDRQSCRK
jgi:hypothetical protein